VLVIQIVTGIFLVMHYKPDAALAFASVEYIMRDVPWGWLIRYMHSTGASAFFVVVYLHMFKALIYGSYRKPRELVWIFGCTIFLMLMAEAFMGYLLPWGQMSYWGAQVIVNLFSAVPFIGPDLSLMIRGDYVVSDATLNRFFSFHVIAVPLVLIGLVVAHLLRCTTWVPTTPTASTSRRRTTRRTPTATRWTASPSTRTTACTTWSASPSS
jgi:ubiquinol-cytochrome c reductase cytochrome b subunit